MVYRSDPISLTEHTADDQRLRSSNDTASDAKIPALSNKLNKPIFANIPVKLQSCKNVSKIGSFGPQF